MNKALFDNCVEIGITALGGAAHGLCKDGFCVSALCAKTMCCTKALASGQNMRGGRQQDSRFGVQ
jgi:hypothetical protein